MWEAVRKLFGKKADKAASAPGRPVIYGSPGSSEADLNPCCDQPHVHIAYRGKADDRLYLARDRKWEEVRYYQPNGLRAFCVKCRRQLL